MSSPLESLPLLVLDSVCEYLASAKDKRRSLFAFSLTSRWLHAVTATERFKRIQIIALDDAFISHEVQQWHEILRPDRYRHVRRITVNGRKTKRINSEEMDGVEEDEDLSSSSGSLYFQYPYAEATEEDYVEECWKPLSALVARLAGLQDLNWIHKDSVPSSILLELHRNPRIRLHVQNFYLPSIDCPRDDGAFSVSPDEYALVTSPSLHSITVMLKFVNEGWLGYEVEPVLQMAAGLTPNSRSVRAVYSPTDGLGPPELAAAWSGYFVANAIKPKPKANLGALERLIIYGERSHQELDTWTLHTDFAVLNTLELHQVVNTREIQKLTQLAVDRRLSCLNSLVLLFSIGVDEREASLDECMRALLREVRPLNTLEVKGPFGKATLETIMRRHGTRLCRLKFSLFRHGLSAFTISDHHIHQLSRHCPNIRHLELDIPRTLGDTFEVQIYRALGTFPKLQDLSLTLDCSIRNSTTMAIEDRGSDQILREVFINCAVDSSLATAIYRIITSNNSSVQSVKLWIRHKMPHNCIHRHRLFGIARWIGRSWKIRRDQSSVTGIVVQELKRQRRERVGRGLPNDLGNLSIDSACARAWGSIWPGPLDKWKEAWRGLPLADVEPSG